MLALNATYYNGQLQLEKKIKISKPIKVIVTFLEEMESPKEKKIKKDKPREILTKIRSKAISQGKPKKNKKGIDLNRFGFYEAMEITKGIKGSVCDALIEERRGE